MPRKKRHKKSDVKVRDLIEQVHALQMQHVRQLESLATVVADGGTSKPPAESRAVDEQLAAHEQKITVLRAQRENLAAEVKSLRDENARQKAVLEGLRVRIWEWRDGVGQLLEDIRVRTSQSMARTRQLQEQHVQLLEQLGDATAHAIVRTATEGEAAERRLMEALGTKRSLGRRKMSVTDLVTLGDRANAKRDWRMAIECYAMALQKDSSLAAIWVQFGHALKESGLLGLAEAAYHRATALDPASGDAFVQLGHFLLRIDQVDAAHAAFAKAAILDKDAAPLVTQASSLISSPVGNRVEAAQSALESIVEETSHADRGEGSAPSQGAPGDGLVSARQPQLWPAEPLNRSLVERYGVLLEEALGARAGQDVIWLGVIDWHFRIQRPQHLASRLAAQGRRIFYVSIAFEAADSDGRFRLLNSPQLNVFELRLRLRGAIPRDIYGGFSDAQVDDIRAALDEAISVLSIRSPAVVVQYPSWYPIAIAVPGALVVHDCLDLVGGFDNVPPAMVEFERLLVRDADLVVTSSQPLAEHVGRQSVLVRNGAEIEFFARGARDGEPTSSERPTIGYFGAIAEWFEIDWVLDCARARPDWRFVLIGNVTGFDRTKKSIPDNVMFTGELPYAELPDRLRDFDVALIPFKLTELIQCTNPVKMYEYMSAGKPVVATAMPEVVNGSDLVYIARDAGDLEAQIARALSEDSPALRQRRRDWAAAHDWDDRARTFADALANATPKVSVVILAYNNWIFTHPCLNSVLTLSDYPNLEVIVVDNASTDETRHRLAAIRDDRVKVVLNDSNLGFAGGNNVGMRAATGDYVVILNNDTYVTTGWVRDLIRPMLIDPSVGLVGPVTNNIGNEQKLSIHYSNMYEMASAARARVRRQLRSRFEASSLAFFCVALARATLDRVGYLDEAYGVGFFEDDDYCRRVEAAGLRMVIADDVFIHHHLSASFDALGAERKRQQMETNKAIYEQKWGAWQPHRYRDVEGYGT